MQKHNRIRSGKHTLNASFAAQNQRGSTSIVGGDPEMQLTNLDLRNNDSPSMRQFAVAQQMEENQKDLEDTISTYTHVQNDQVKYQIESANQIRANEEERIFKFQFTKNIDCTSMMKDFNTECHTLNYQLKRLVADKDSHQILHPKRVENIEVIPNTYMFFKVVTKDQLAPGKLSFSYCNGEYVKARRVATNYSGSGDSPTSPNKKKLKTTLVELLAYFSTNEKNREPTKENCDKVLENPSGTIMLPLVGKDRFENDEVYVSLFSITGCTVNLTVSFPDLKIQHFNRRKQQDDFTDEMDFEKYLVCKNYKKATEGRGTDKDFFIKGHVKKVGNFSSFQAKRAHDLVEKRELLALDAASRKKADDTFDHKMKYFKLHKWSLIRQIREEKEENARERLNTKKQLSALIKLAATYLMIIKIKDKYIERK